MRSYDYYADTPPPTSFACRRHDGRVVYSKGNDHIIDTVRCAMLAREQANLDLVGEETVSLKPVLTDPVFL